MNLDCSDVIGKGEIRFVTDQFAISSAHNYIDCLKTNLRSLIIQISAATKSQEEPYPPSQEFCPRNYKLGHADFSALRLCYRRSSISIECLARLKSEKFRSNWLLRMDAKTGSVASDDSLRAAHPKQHSYEQVFSTFSTPQQPQFIQCKYLILHAKEMG